jgi:acyl-homoserine-lactone acylase
MHTPPPRLLLAALLAGLTLSACRPPDPGPTDGGTPAEDGGSADAGGTDAGADAGTDAGTPGDAGTYRVTVTRTAFGIPHVKATDYGSLGYGVGYSIAQGNLCTLAEEVVTATGKRTRYFGAGAQNANVLSDAFYTWHNRASQLTTFLDAQPPQVRAAIRGYAAGFSRVVRETPNTDSRCAGAAYVRELTELDLAAVYNRGNTRGGLLNFVPAIAAAAPPQTTPGGGKVQPTPEEVPPLDLSSLKPGAESLRGSNAYALGAETTANGTGMLLGNPHEPWDGVQRFYEFHLTLPGELDVMGAAQQGQPFVNIGFNKDVAWSHTVSTARRFTFYMLQLVPGNPLKYVYRNAQGVDEQRDITAQEVTVTLSDGTTTTRRIYTSHFGPMVALNLVNAAFPAWGTNNVAFAIRDAAAANPRGIEQWWRMNQATSVQDLEQKMGTILGLPFVNTLAADRAGNALYADLSTVPHVTTEKYAACRLPDALAALRTGLESQGLPTLVGSSAACEWGADADAPQAGIFGKGNLPTLTRRDYTLNSNDSYWLSHDTQRLTGFSPLLRGLQAEASARTLRTRMAFRQVLDRLAGTDGLAGNRFTLENLQAVTYSNRSLAAELALGTAAAPGPLLQACQAASPAELQAWPTSTSGTTVDATAACAALAAWDRRNDLTSRGAHVFREFWRGLSARTTASTLWSVPFDPADPINTPRGLVVGDTAKEELGDAVRLWQQLGVAMDEQLGTLQYVTADGTAAGERIPMHGGRGEEGVFNVVVTGADRPPGLAAGGLQAYTPILGGPTYMQTVTFDAAGPVAFALLGFGQSADPADPNFQDQKRRYSQKQWIALPFSEAAITAAREGEVLQLVE